MIQLEKYYTAEKVKLFKEFINTFGFIILNAHNAVKL